MQRTVRGLTRKELHVGLDTWESEGGRLAPPPPLTPAERLHARMVAALKARAEKNRPYREAGLLPPPKLLVAVGMPFWLQLQIGDPRRQ